MKRFYIFVFLLFVLSLGVFAQVSFSGDAYVGVEVEKPALWDNTVRMNHREEGAPKFNLAAVAARENYGVKLDLTCQTTNPFTINGIYGWAYFWENQIRLTMGKISDGIWVSRLDPDNEIAFDEITGFRAEYKTPLEGLNVGTVFVVNDLNFDKFLKKTRLGASYIQYLFNGLIAYDMGKNASFLAAFNFTGIDDLTDAGVELLATNLATWDSDVPGYIGMMQIKEKVGYRIMRPLNVSLLLGQTIYKHPDDPDDPDSNFGMFFKPMVSYRILSDLTASISVEFSTENKFKQTDFTLTPCVEYSLKGPALVYVQYEFNLVDITDTKQDNHKFGFGIDIKAF